MGVSEEQEPLGQEETQESSGRGGEDFGGEVSFEGFDDVLPAGPEEAFPSMSLGGEGPGGAFEEALLQPEEEGAVSGLL